MKRSHCVAVLLAMPWKQFIKAHWDSLCGCDFFTVEALGLTGTVRYMVFFVIVACLNHLVLFGERHLHHVIKEFIAHYHGERFHQGLGGQLIEEKEAGSSRNNGARGRSSAGLGWAAC
jgi:hypothetical protein